MEPTQFAEVDFLTPLTHLGIGGIFLVFTLPLLIHGFFRRHRFSKLSDGYQTYKARSSIRTELLIGTGTLLVTLGLGISFVVGYSTANSNLIANIEQRYQPVDLQLGVWNGSWVSVDMTLADGTHFPDSVVQIRANYEPFIEDVWYHQNPSARS